MQKAGLVRIERGDERDRQLDQERVGKTDGQIEECKSDTERGDERER